MPKLGGEVKAARKDAKAAGNTRTAKNAPSPELKEQRNKAYRDAEAKARREGKTPDEAKQEGANAAKQTGDAQKMGRNKALEEAGVTRSEGPIGKQEPGTSAARKDANGVKEKTLKDKLTSPAGIALLAGLGLTLAAAISLIALSAQACEACENNRDWGLTITSIKPTPSTIPLIGGFFKPSTIDVSYSPKDGAYEPLEGKETFTFKDTGFPELDDQTFTIDKVLGKNKVQVKCGGGDCSDLDGTKGAINPNCADFNDRFNHQVEKAGEAAGSGIGSLFKGIFKNMGTFLFVIGVCFLFYFLIKVFSKS